MSSAIETDVRQLAVTVTEGFDGEVAAELVKAWRLHVAVTDPEVYMRKAAGDIPQYIQFIGGIIDWSVLKLPAIAFLSRLGYLLADDVMSWARGKLRAADATVVDQLAVAIHTAQQKLSSPTKVLVAIELPDNRWGTALELETNDPALLGKHLALYAVNIERIAELINDRCQRGDGPLSQGKIVIRDDDHIEVSWVSRDFQRIQFILAPDSPTNKNTRQ